MRFDVIPVEIPFRTAFSHASARRKASAAVMVRLCDDDGLCGYGEGCPRQYVTGETVATALLWLRARVGPFRETIQTVTDLCSLCESHEAEIDRNPSAFCAFELAILDLMARRKHLSIEALLGLCGPCPPQQVTAVSGTDNPLTFRLQAWRFKHAGMTEAKLKIGGEAARNLSRIKHLGRFAAVRLDGNNFWSDSASAIDALTPFKDRVWAVEEPVKARDFAAMKRIQAETGLKIILDESLLNRRDLEAFLALDPDPDAFVVNLRVSKLGGLLRSLDLAQRLRAQGFGLIIGAQVGETSCLARAALVLSQGAGPLLGFEAGYGCHLLAHDAFLPSLTFDRRGGLDMQSFSLEPAGLGLRPNGLVFSDEKSPK